MVPADILTSSSMVISSGKVSSIIQSLPMKTLLPILTPFLKWLWTASDCNDAIYSLVVDVLDTKYGLSEEPE